MLYAIIAGALFAAYHVSTTFRRPSRLPYYIATIALFVFVGFRFEVGCDWNGYYNQFRIAYWRGFDGAVEDVEPLWWIAVYLLSDLDFIWLNAFAAALFFGGAHVLIRRQPNPLGMLAFMFPILIVNMPMSAMRQGAAIGLLCIAATAIIDRKPLKYALWVALAAGIHSSSAIFLLITPMLIGRKMPLSLRLFATFLLALPGAYFIFMGEGGQQAVERYFETGYDAYGAYFRLGLLTLSGLFFALVLNPSWKREFPKDYPLVAIGAVCMVLIIALAPISSVIADRLGYYLIPIQAMMFSRMAAMRTLPNAKLLAIAPSVGILIFFTAWTFESQHFSTCFLPYYNWFG